MNIGETKKWAKTQGYEIIKDKDDGLYYWAKIDSNDPAASGVCKSVSKVARAVFNHITNHVWLDHQQEYETNKEIKRITLTDYGT